MTGIQAEAKLVIRSHSDAGKSTLAEITKPAESVPPEKKI